MIRTWKKIGAGMILCIFMAGCGSQNEVYLETEVSQDTGNVQETEEPEARERLDILDVSGVEQTGSVDLPEVSGEEWAAEAALAPETTEDADKAERVSGKCYVYVCGEVAEPGVYVLEPGDRIYEAVEMAGGTPAAALDAASNALCALMGLVCDPVGGLVEIPGEGNAEAHSSGSLSAMMGCNCLVELPAGSGPVTPGEEVEVLNFVQ